MSRIDRRGPFPTIDLDDRRAAGDLKFSAFTWCRFMAAASLMRIAASSGEQAPWRQLALRYMEHVHTKLWNRTDAATAPVKRATRDDMTLCSWIQAAEWDGVLLREIEEGLPPMGSGRRDPRRYSALTTSAPARVERALSTW